MVAGLVVEPKGRVERRRTVQHAHQVLGRVLLGDPRVGHLGAVRVELDGRVVDQFLHPHVHRPRHLAADEVAEFLGDAILLFLVPALDLNVDGGG